MIKLRNVADVVLELTQAGNLTVAANADAILVPFNGKLIGVQAFVGTAGVGTSGVVDVLQNEVSIYGGTKLTLVAAAREATYVAPANDPVTVSRGDIFTLKVTTAFGTTPSVDLVVALLFRVAKQSAPGASFQGDFGLIAGDAE